MNLNEGLVFFKNSKRINSLADKIIKSSNYSPSEIGIVVSKLRGIADLFKIIEDKYSEADSSEKKEQAKKEYELLKEKYVNFIKIINKESILIGLKKAGIVSVVSASLLLLLKSIYDFEGETKLAGSRNFLVPYVSDARIQALINKILMLGPGVFFSSIGIMEVFKKVFGTRGNRIYEQTREALSKLEKTEKMPRIKKIEGQDEYEQERV